MRFVMRRVLWTLVPIGSLGLLGWVPPLRIALRRKTPGAWLWFAGSAGAGVLIIVLVGTLSGPDNTPPGWVGWLEIVNIVFTAVYTGIATKALTPRPRPVPYPQVPYPPRAQAASSYAPSADQSAAAEVQAELRELRDLLGESAAGQARGEASDRATGQTHVQPGGQPGEHPDRRGQW